MMELLQALGVNHTVLYQLAIFIVVFFSVKEIAFKPYADAFDKREAATKGSMSGVDSLNKSIEELHSTYEEEARSLNDEIKTIFDVCRGEAQREAEKIMNAAREESSHLIKTTKEKIGGQLGQAIQQAKAEAPGIAQAMVQKLLA